jgi:type II secretory pathway component GspD/PulD (secretin)
MFIRFIGPVSLLATGLFAVSVHAQTQYSGLTPVSGVAPAPAPAKMVLRVYAVADLVAPIAYEGTDEHGDKHDAPRTQEDRLIKMILNAVDTNSWAANTTDRSRGTIDFFPQTMSLVVNQTPEIHEKVAELLAKLRKQQDVQVALEVRLLTIPDAFFERVGVDFNVNVRNDEPAPHCDGYERVGIDFNSPRPVTRCEVVPATSGKPAAATTFLSEKQLAQFLEAAQGDQRANIMQAPKLTLDNGQAAAVEITDKQFFVTRLDTVKDGDRTVTTPKNEAVTTGFRMKVWPFVSADRRFVQVYLKVDQTDLASSAVPLFPVHGGKDKVQFVQQPALTNMSVEKTLTIPDGGTALLGGLKKISEGRNEYGPPVLSKVPYVNRLFKNVGYGREAQTVYVLVTPRVIVNEQEARCQTGAAEESEPCPLTRTAPPARRPSKALAELLSAYDEACADGRSDEAAKFAQAALILDPTCFARKRGR